MSNGDCFTVAAKLVIDSRDDLDLCHGLAYGRPGGDAHGKWFDHAWVETADGLVIDKSNGLDVKLPRSIYYSLGKIDADKVKRYNATETRVTMLRYMHWGPWDERYPPKRKGSK